MSMVTFDTITARGLMDNAIHFCASKTGLGGRDEVIEALHRGDCSICDYLRHGLAKEIAGYLGSMDDTVKAIYTFNPEYSTDVETAGADQPSLSPAISLIAWVSRKTAASSSVVTSLSLALARECEQLGCPKANALCHQLDVQVVDDDDVNGRIGYGALVSSLTVRPTEIWRR